MILGNIDINDFFLGPSQITSIWLGNLEVWRKIDEYTYIIDNVTINYLPYDSSVTSILPTGANYASVIGRVQVYKNGVLDATYPTITLTTSTSSPYIKNSSNKLYFNVDSYGTTNMSSSSNPFYVNVTTSYSGTAGPTVQVAVTPNLVTSTQTTNWANSGVTSTSFLSYNQTSFSITNRNRATVRTNYSSGKYTTSTQYIGGYLYSVDTASGTNTLLSTIGANGSYTINVGSTNTGTYPKVLVYRLSHSSTASGYDDWIYMMQKSSSNTSGLQLYWGSTKVTDGWIIETSTYFYLANNGHTASTTYAWQCTDQTIEITQEGGVFYFDNVTSSTDCGVTITDNNGNTTYFEIYGA